MFPLLQAEKRGRETETEPEIDRGTERKTEASPWLIQAFFTTRRVRHCKVARGMERKREEETEMYIYINEEKEIDYRD